MSGDANAVSSPPENTGCNNTCSKEEPQMSVCGRVDTSAEDRAKREALEARLDKGWEAFIAKMGTDGADGNTDNFDAEELAARLSTKVDKTGQLHAKILLQKIYHFWHCKQHTDMILIAGSAREEVHLHMFLAHTEFYEKIVLIPESEKMWREGKLVIDMSGLVAPKALKLIVAYVYTGALKITLDNVTDIAMAAKAMGLRRLQVQCTEFLDYVFADFHLFTLLTSMPVDHKFFDVAWTKVLTRFGRVCTDPAFLELDIDRLELLVSSEKIDVESEYQIFRAVLAWINHDRPKREEHFFTLMAHVRFAYMDIEELISCMQEESTFATNPEAQKMLEEADMYATMESMGDQWTGYPPWPPRNDTIRRVQQRKKNLAQLRPKTKAEICNEDLPVYMQAEYGCKWKKGDQNKDGEAFQPQDEKSETDSYGPDDEPKTSKVPSNRRVLLEGKESSTNRAQLLARLRAQESKTSVDTATGADVETEEETQPPPSRAAQRRSGNKYRGAEITDANYSRGPSEISLPSCMMKNPTL